MSDTTFIHEIRPGTPVTRVSLTMDIDEVMALGYVAGAAIDASVLAKDMVDAETAVNAQEILRWAAKAVDALQALTPASDDTE
jgi:hypothetical protein